MVSQQPENRGILGPGQGDRTPDKPATQPADIRKLWPGVRP
jgi:hypothetical protein